MNNNSIYHTDACGTAYGDYLTFEGDVTDKELAEAKELLIQQACDTLKAIAEEREDFFIIKKLGDKTTVAWKFFIPSIEITE